MLASFKPCPWNIAGSQGEGVGLNKRLAPQTRARTSRKAETQSLEFWKDYLSSFVHANACSSANTKTTHNVLSQVTFRWLSEGLFVGPHWPFCTWAAATWAATMQRLVSARLSKCKPWGDMKQPQDREQLLCHTRTRLRNLLPG